MSTTVTVTEGLLAKLYDITVQQGADFNLVVLYKDAAGSIITTLDSAELQARVWAGADSAKIDLAEGEGLTIDESAGSITIFIAAATTTALDAPENLIYDLEAGLDGGLRVRLLEGQCLVTAGVTIVD